MKTETPVFTRKLRSLRSDEPIFSIFPTNTVLQLDSFAIKPYNISPQIKIKMALNKSKIIIVFLALFGLVYCQKDDDTSTVFIEAAQALFENKEAIGGLQGVARAFMQSDTGKQV